MDKDIELFLVYNIELGGDGEVIIGDIDKIINPLWTVEEKKEKIENIRNTTDMEAIRAPRVIFLEKAYRFLEKLIGFKSGDGYFSICPWDSKEALVKEFGEEAIDFFGEEHVSIEKKSW